MHQYYSLAAVGFVMGLALAEQQPEPKKYALLVAVTTYEHPLLNKPPLEGPENDARAVAAELKKSGYVVKLLLGRDANQKALIEALDDLRIRGNQTGAVLVGLFGHGVEYAERLPNGRTLSISYFLPHNTSMRQVRQTDGGISRDEDGKPMIEADPKSLVSMTEVFEALRLSKAGNRILLADCCRNNPNAARGQSFGANVNVSDLPDRTAALLACSAGQKAFEDTANRRGAFTKCILDVLQRSSGRLTAARLGEQVQDAVPRLVAELSNGREKQTPRYMTVDTVDLLLALKPDRGTNNNAEVGRVSGSGAMHKAGGTADKSGRSQRQEPEKNKRGQAEDRLTKDVERKLEATGDIPGVRSVLSDVLAFTKDEFGVEVIPNLAAFKADLNIDNVNDCEVRLPKMKNVSLRVILKLVADNVGGVAVARAGYVELTTKERLKEEARKP